jgi:hypothetical protein
MCTDKEVGCWHWYDGVEMNYWLLLMPIIVSQLVVCWVMCMVVCPPDVGNLFGT